MRLSDIMSGVDLTVFPQIALVIILLASVAIVAHTFSKRHQAQWQEAARLPLDADEPAQDREEGTDG